MRIMKVAEGAYFVPSYSVQTLTANYSRETAQQVLQTTQEDEGSVDEDEMMRLEGN